MQVVFAISWFALPSEFTHIFSAEPDRIVKNWYMFFCVAVGLWGGLIIGIVTEYFTSNRYRPVQVICRSFSSFVSCRVLCCFHWHCIMQIPCIASVIRLAPGGAAVFHLGSAALDSIKLTPNAPV